MTQVKIDTELVSRSAKHVAAGQNRVGNAWTTLSGELDATEGMAGNPGKDAAAARFVAAYTPAAQAVWRGFSALHKSVGDMSRGLTQTAKNHAKADQHSVIGSRFSMVPRQPGSFRDGLLGFVVSDPLNVQGPALAAGPGKEAPRSLLETVTGIDLIDVTEYWPTADWSALNTAAASWRSAHDSLVEIRGQLVAEVNTVTTQGDAPDLDAFRGYWGRLYGGAATALFASLPQLCSSISKACSDYAGAVMQAQMSVNSVSGNPIAAVAQAAAVRAAMAEAAGRLLQTVGVISAGALAGHLVTSVVAGATNAPNVRILEAETDEELVYEPGGKHGRTERQTSRGPNSAEPTDGQEALENSVPLGENTDRRVGVDKENGEIVVLDKTHPYGKEYHGHVRKWEDLRDEMKNALRRAGLVNKKGKIL
ncbi:hypothetical protein E1287_06680 [Actinomadura sp. KC06]|uniref:WXG100-like domain-containing protein n=1 Tax=Actinomadura sp. KC06 TaxID=2530369 RepID=UPI00104A01A9|nr:hypothetical protein [Actinomadura sp. KC06]TDD37984.1 hypothetical protein E1287_06680 [Actinomadura sp. KC06]